MKMADGEIEEIPMLSSTRSQLSDEHTNVGPQRLTPKTRSASMSIPMYSMKSHENEIRFVSHSSPLRSERQTPLTQTSGPLYSNQKTDTLARPMLAVENRTLSTVNIEEYPSFNGTDPITWLDNNLAGKNEHLLRSGQLGMCNDPYCTTCPTYYTFKPAQSSSRFELKLRNILSGDAEGWMKKSFSFLGSCVPGIMNPHAKVVQQWNKFFVISCSVAVFVDPLFFFLLSVQKEYKCIVLDWRMATTLAIMRSITDFVYLLHMLLQFRVAFVSPESRVVGAGELVDQPKKIALHYLYGYFSIDVFAVLPLPQIMIMFVFPTYFESSSADYAKYLLRATVLLQYFPRFYRFLPLLAGHSASGFIFETASANFVHNFFICALAGHVVGSCWYLFGLQRVNQCLRTTCAISNLNCTSFIDCGRGNNIGEIMLSQERRNWINDTISTGCFDKEGDFNYGIYKLAVELTTVPSIITRYMYSFFWGFQQIGTLAGNQEPSYFVWEIIFVTCIVGLGLFLFALLVGNMQNYLQALGRRRLEMQLRHRDVDQWMRHRRLPEELRRQVRQSERFHWAATRGVNEEVLLENLPEDLQRDIRRHLFSFIKKLRVFARMEDRILDAICGRLRQNLYINDNKILYDGGVIDRMFFIVRGKLLTVDADGNQAPLSEGDFCGEELLSWCLDHSSKNKDRQKIRVAEQRLLSNRTVTCLTNVEAFSLRATDFEEVATLFPSFLRRVENATRRDSPYWKGFAATTIQVAWRYRKKRLRQAEA